MPLDVAKRGTLDRKDPPLKAIVAANDNYEAGYHKGNPGGLDAVDTDLAPANIKKDVVIFGITGTYEQTISVTEALAATNSGNDLTGSWLTIFTVPIPANQIRVFCWANIVSENPDDVWEVQILYNGVQKATASGTGDHVNHPCQWEGAGLGSAANILIQSKKSSGSTPWFSKTAGGCWRATS